MNKKKIKNMLLNRPSNSSVSLSSRDSINLSSRGLTAGSRTLNIISTISILFIIPLTLTACQTFSSHPTTHSKNKNIALYGREDGSSHALQKGFYVNASTGFAL